MREDGQAESAKLGPAATMRVTVVFCWMPPPVPVTVMGYVPVGVVLPTVTVMVEMPSPGAGIVWGLKLTVVPFGMPEADKLTEPLKPLPRITKMLELPCWPWATVRVAGMAVIVKLPFPAGVMVSVTVAVCWIPPPLPVTVIGYVPVGAMFLSVMVMIEVPDPGAPIELGLKVTDTPRG